MTVLKFTAAECQLLDCRLSVCECIAEALTDYDPETDPAPRFTHTEVQTRANEMFVELCVFHQLTIETELDKEILGDAIDGSTFPYFVADALESEEMSAEQARTWRRAMTSVETKAKRVGADAKFPPT